MGNKNILKTVHNGEVLYRTPVGFWWHYLDPLAENSPQGDPLVPSLCSASTMTPDLFWGYQSEEAIQMSIRGHKNDFLAWQPDFVKIMSDGFFSHPSILGLEFSDASDLDKIKSVGSSHEWMQKQVDFVGELTEFYNGEGMSFYNILSPIQQIRIYIEYSKRDAHIFNRLLVEDRERLAKAAEIVASDTIELVDRLKKRPRLTEFIILCSRRSQWNAIGIITIATLSLVIYVFLTGATSCGVTISCMCAVMSIIGMISPIMRNIQRAFITGLCIRREFPCERGREFLTESSLGDLIIIQALSSTEDLLARLFRQHEKLLNR